MEKEFDFKNELSGKIALVTRGTKETGKAIIERLQQAGAKVIITARNAPQDVSNQLHFTAADLSKVEGSNKVVQEVLSGYGKLDILINNLGGSEIPGGGFAVLKDEDWEHNFQTNIPTPVCLYRRFLPGMIKRKSGVIITSKKQTTRKVTYFFT